MEKLFLELLNRSIPASFLVLVIVLFRFFLKKAPKCLQCFLWALLAIRLICPISIESNFSLAPSANIINRNMYGEPLYVQSGIAAIDTSVNEYLESYYDKKEVMLENQEKLSLSQIGALLWFVGVCIFAIYAIFSYIKIKSRVRESISVEKNIYICDRISTPFILGVVKPQIYLPSNLDEIQRKCIVAHEQAHLKRFDHLWKPFAFLLLLFYWFCPCCWLAYVFFCRDMELACDEKVIKHMNLEEKKNYSKVLLSFSIREKVISVCPLAFGELGVKQRIKEVLNYKKPKFKFIFLSIAAIMIISICFLTNPKEHIQDSTPVLESTEEDTYPKRIEISTPIIDLDAPTGADGSSIYYADKDKFIFGGYYGLFVYDMTSNQIVRSIDLEAIGCNFTQGDFASEILVTKDGATVLIRPLVSNQMYVYSVNENVMWMEADDLNGYTFFENKQVEGSNLQDGKYASFVENGKEKMLFLVNDTTLGELGYTLEASSNFQKIFGAHVEDDINPNMATNSRNSDGTPSRAYVDYLQEKISEDMANGTLPFVVSSSIMEDPLRLEVGVLELTEEYINQILSYENNGSAITIVKKDGNVLQDL